MSAGTVNGERTCRLLRALAAGPGTQPGCTAAHEAAREISGYLAGAGERGDLAVTDVLLLRWRTLLDRGHRELEREDPGLWELLRAPGSWLDGQLRLRSLLAHEIAKAYWTDAHEVRYSEIDIERYLWGPR